jgi:GxxExxY protein
MQNLTEQIIGCAIEVHRNLGPGLLESLYEKALCHKFESHNINYANQCVVPILYKGKVLGEHRLDFVVENRVVELKAAERIEPDFKAQLLSYLKLTGNNLGLLINFNVPALKDGVTRIIL